MAGWSMITWVLCSACGASGAESIVSGREEARSASVGEADEVVEEGGESL